MRVQGKQMGEPGVTKRWTWGRPDRPQGPEPGRPTHLQLMKELAWRTGLLGIGLFLVLTDDPSRNLRMNVLAYVVALVWCRYDGALSHGRWGAAAFEAIVWYIASVGFARLLLLLLGEPMAPPQ